MDVASNLADSGRTQPGAAVPEAVRSAGRAGEDAVQAALHYFGLRVSEVAPGIGSYSSTVRLLTLHTGERVVLKIPYVRRKLLREITALTALSDLPVPRVLDAWIPDSDAAGAMLLSFLPGDVAEGVASTSLATAMGELLARLHTHRLSRYGEVHQQAGDTVQGEGDEQNWWALLLKRSELWRAQCRIAMPAKLFTESIALYERLAGSLPEPDGPVWTHHDYRPGNILTVGEEITGLIDFESARGGSADLDFVKMSHDLWKYAPGAKPSFLQGYAQVRPLPPIDRTLTFYQLHNALGGVAWCVRRTDRQDPFFIENMDVIQDLVARNGEGIRSGHFDG